MLHRPLICAAITAALCTHIAPTLHAASLNDPFSTAEMVKPPPAPALASDEGFQPCPAPQTIAMTLTDVVAAALCGNPQTREVWANARASAAALGQATAAYLPAINASVAANHNRNRGGSLASTLTQNQRSGSVELSWLIADFGGREAGQRNAQALLDAANATQDAMVQAIFLRAAQAYYQLQSSQEIGRATQEAEKAAEESFKAADARYHAGIATPADKLQAQTAWSQATLSRIKAEGDAIRAQGTLANVMGLNATTPVTLDQPADEDDLPSAGQFSADIRQLTEQATRQRPDLLAASAQSRAAEAGADRARASGRPRLSLGISGGETRSGVLPDAKNTVLGLTLNIPLFSGFDTTYSIRAAEAQTQSTLAQQDRLRLQVSLDVWNSYQALSTATQTLSTTADLLASARQSRAVALGRYKSGVGNIIDLLSAQSALASAHQQRVQALYGWNTARLSLAQAMGALDQNTIASLEKPTAP